MKLEDLKVTKFEPDDVGSWKAYSIIGLAPCLTIATYHRITSDSMTLSIWLALAIASLCILLAEPLLFEFSNSQVSAELYRLVRTSSLYLHIGAWLWTASAAMEAFEVSILGQIALQGLLFTPIIIKFQPLAWIRAIPMSALIAVSSLSIGCSHYWLVVTHNNRPMTSGITHQNHTSLSVVTDTSLGESLSHKSIQLAQSESPLDPKNRVIGCDRVQLASPVNFNGNYRATTESLSSSKPLTFSKMNALSNIEFKDIQSKNWVMLNGSPRTFDSFEVKSPSEHTIDGLASQLELQLFSSMNQGTRQAYSFLIEIGPHNSSFNDFVNVISSQGTSSSFVIESKSLFGNDSTFWVYKGSLTSPPCTAMEWHVSKSPIFMSGQQIELIRNMNPKSAQSVVRNLSPAEISNHSPKSVAH